MADYFTQEVVTRYIRLTEPMRKALIGYLGAAVDLVEEENVLDSLVGGLQAHTYAVVFQEGWRDADPSDDGDEENSEVDRLRKLSKEHFFREVLKINPGLEAIELQSAWTCSRMRLDGFGGSGLVVTRKGYIYITTGDFVVGDDGVVAMASKFTEWEAE